MTKMIGERNKSFMQIGKKVCNIAIMVHYKRLFATLLLALAFHVCAAQDWQLKKENGDLKLYTADQKGSAFKSVKVEDVFKGRISQLVAAITDLDRHTEWVYKDKCSKLLTKVSDNEIIYQSEVEVPWPASNRDYVARLKVVQVSPTVVTVISNSEPDLAPERSGVVRIKNFSSSWTITATGNNTVKVEYLLNMDPGGSTPAWLINLFVTKGPYETFMHLHDEINKPEYQNAHLSYVQD
jgi:START domain